MTEPLDQPDIVMPGLLRHARNTYGTAMRRALAAAGYDDIPRNGLYLIGGLALGGDRTSLEQCVRELRLSRQAAGQLVDALVARGYVTHGTSAQPGGPAASLTTRGRAAATVQMTARRRVDAELLTRVGQEDVDRTRRTLMALIDMGDALERPDRES